MHGIETIQKLNEQAATACKLPKTSPLDIQTADRVVAGDQVVEPHNTGEEIEKSRTKIRRTLLGTDGYDDIPFRYQRGLGSSARSMGKGWHIAQSTHLNL